MYQHIDINGHAIELPVGKVVCVGQNYHDHIKEMNSIVNGEAVLFMKPNTAICSLLSPVVIPSGQGECHNEAEIAVLINKPLKAASPQQAIAAIWGVGIGLDLTLRDVQRAMKELGRPWEVAKSFDLSAPVSPFIPLNKVSDLSKIEFSLTVNDVLRQQGQSALMIRSIAELVSIISKHFTLLPGDIVFTGTPKGVAPLFAGDKLSLTLENHQFEGVVSND
ncbi:fumarylacetoacetate hydrolase family protein [Thalassotalea sp. M1531]|uniref:Fumarylacetoacetate hydrolase family protein n=1 Tax=Thalassotalea algicola TaxID=2716224 RepID=A0A7Y0LHQ7_9GAMM|nr:fumarylacetoacetate hydrolase family protein [Thalassotalea algicola]NMP33475.1 fumarylacetoacetate hydrolase family protein [Thalassotalea algicola]